MVTLYHGHLAHPGPNPGAGDGGWYDYFTVGNPGVFDPNAIVTPAMGLCIDIAIGWCDASNTCFAPGVPQALGWWLNMTLCSTSPRTVPTLPTTYVPNAGTKVVIWSRPATGSTSYSIDFDLTGVATVYCAYGTRPTVGAAAVAFVTDALITAACAALGAPWAALLFQPLIGWAFDTGVLCGAGPPSLAPITEHTPLDSLANRLEMLKAMVWYQLCECIPGATTPTPYPIPTPTQPPHWPTLPTYTCSDADVCATLLYILKRLDQLSSSQNITLTNNTTVNNYAVSVAYNLAPVFFDVTGSGSIDVAGLVGLRLELTEGGGTKVLEGIPPYQWDVGWVSVSDGGAMLQERRLTRSSMEWFPPEMSLATTVGYFLKGDQHLRIWQLVPVTDQPAL